MDTYHRSRRSILATIFSQPIIGCKNWTSTGFMSSGGLEPQVGDLVSPSLGFRDTKWYLGWIRGIEEKDGWTHYLLESLEDGAQCWWHNISIDIYDREIFKKFPSLCWSDAQFEFKDTWAAEVTELKTFAVRPALPVFGADYKVTLDVQISHALSSSFANPQTYPDFRKVTAANIRGHFKRSLQGYAAHKEQ